MHDATRVAQVGLGIVFGIEQPQFCEQGIQSSFCVALVEVRTHVRLDGRYVIDATADSILAADDATAILQKVLMDSYPMPCEKK